LWVCTVDWTFCCYPSLGLTTKAKVCKGASQEGSLGVRSHAPKSVGECEGMNLHTFKWVPTLGVKVPMDSRIFREQFQGSKPIGLKRSLYHWKFFGTWMSKMGSHDPFQYLTHRLWPKERMGVKLEVWLPPTKSQESPRFLACKWSATYYWKALNNGYNIFFNFISIRGSKTKLWAPKAVEVSTLGISELPLGGPKTKCHLGVSPMAKHRIYYKGEGGGFPQVRVLWVWVCPWLVLAPKVFKLCTNQLVIWFVQVCVRDWSFIILPRILYAPAQYVFIVYSMLGGRRVELQHTPLPPKCCELGSMPQLLTLPLFSPQTRIWVYQGAWERVTFEAMTISILEFQNWHQKG
jgi:hypothetical protein